MPSRTYIQMLWKLHNTGKLPLCKEISDSLTKYNAVLEKHPEAIEEVVQRRVNMIKHTKNLFPSMMLAQPHYIIFERCILDYMFMAELIEPPMFDDFDAKPNLTPNLTRIAMGLPSVIDNAIAVLDSPNRTHGYMQRRNNETVRML